MELGIILKNDELVVDSLTVAEVFEKEHKKVLRDIRYCISEIENMEIDVSKFGPISYIDANDYFYEDSIRDSYGRKRKIYYMNQKGFTLLVMEIGLAGFEEIVNYCTVKNKLKLAYVKATAQDFQASEVDQAQPPLFSILGLLDYKEEVAT
ncbi:Rha family transcriptional regulator [Streptococcus suis]|uniref:Rha family transcriptional regulator n=1 Tax=Streptococcus suis TaxID=1307 RepID=UPI0038BC650A